MRDDFIAACTELMAATHEEDGCEHYSLAADLTDPGRFHVSERWTSKAQMDEHSASAHLADVRGEDGRYSGWTK